MYKQIERIRKEKGRVRAVLYARCSSDEQRKNGYTITDQLEFGRHFCRENDIILVGEYVDEGISATLEIKKRKDLANLIRDAKSDNYDIAVFKCIDRFFRNTEEYYAAQKQLRTSGVTWVSIEEPDLDPYDADAAFKINIYLAMAEYEARKTSKRICFNNKMRIKNKQVVTGAQCFLFPWTVTGEQKNRHLIKNKEKEGILYDLLDFYETRQSKAATLGYINNKYDMNIAMTTLNNLLSDTLLYGEYKGIPDYVEPYITKERFDHIQDIIKRNVRKPHVPGRTFLFGGMIRCPECHNKLSGNFVKSCGKYDVYVYRCNNARVQKTCHFTKSISEKKMEKQLLDNLSRYIGNEVVRVESITEVRQENKNIEKVNKLKAEIDRLNLMFRKGRIDEKEYDKEYYVLSEEIKKFDIEEEPPERDLKALKELLETDYRGLYDQLTKENKKAFWRKFIKEFTVSEYKHIVPESIIFF